jgi:hypothetical protein
MRLAHIPLPSPLGYILRSRFFGHNYTFLHAFNIKNLFSINQRISALDLGILLSAVAVKISTSVLIPKRFYILLLSYRRKEFMIEILVELLYKKPYVF